MNMVDRILCKLREIVASHSRRRLTDQEIARINTLRDVDFESVQILSYLMAVEREFGFEIEEAGLAPEFIADLHKMAGYVVSRIQKIEGQSLSRTDPLS